MAHTAPNTHHRHNATGASADPTRTATLRQRAVKTFNRLWRRIRGAIRETIQRNDALGLNSPSNTPSPRRPTQANRPRSFGVTDMASRRAMFREWFRHLTRTVVLQPTETQAVLDGEHFTNDFVATAVARGIVRATVEARKAGYSAPATTSFSASDLLAQERYQKVLRDQRLTAYEDLERAVQDTQREVNGTLAEEMVAGVALTALTGALTDRVAHSTAGSVRTMHAANAAVVRAVNAAAIRRYQELGVEEVGVEPESVPDDGDDEGDGGDTPDGPDSVEWLTSRDRRVCSQCRELAGDTYTISDVLSGEAPMPVKSTHPSCRCFYRPVDT